MRAAAEGLPSRTATAALAFLVGIAAASLGAGLLGAAGHFSPLAIDLGAILQAPSSSHWLGTDGLGRDVASRLVNGARGSLGVGVLATAVSVLLALALGTAAGYRGGVADALLSRSLEVVQTFPVLLLVLAVLACWPHPGRWVVGMVLGATRAAELARLARIEALRIRGLAFVTAARALGSPGWRILLSHVVPHAVGPVLVAAGLGLGNLILAESALAFLGLGAAPPTPSWGELLLEARDHPQAWWLVLAPGAVLFATVVSANHLAESLRDRLVVGGSPRAARKLPVPQGSS
jgi:peptide/nickel transport system permease protein